MDGCDWLWVIGDEKLMMKIKIAYQSNCKARFSFKWKLKRVTQVFTDFILEEFVKRTKTIDCSYICCRWCKVGQFKKAWNLL